MPEPPFETVASVAARLLLEPHPEGGFFKRWFPSPAPGVAATAAAAEAAAAAARPPAGACSSILYLLPAGAVCTLHALRGSDELWFFQGGSPLTVVELLAGGGVQRTQITAGAPHAVPAGRVFGACLPAAAPGAPPWALVACVVAPGFDWANWEHPFRAELLQRFPGEEAVVAELGRADE